MIIADMSYLEVAAEAKKLEGGVDFSSNYTGFESVIHMLESSSNSGLGGSSSTTKAMNAIIKSYGGSTISLG